jgi:uncharacterized protein YciI
MDITDGEKKLMQEHVVYWTGFQEKGKMLAFGPVADPKGFWGLGLFQVENELETKTLTDNDPVIRAGVGFSYEIYPMPQLKMAKSI